MSIRMFCLIYIIRIFPETSVLTENMSEFMEIMFLKIVVPNYGYHIVRINHDIFQLILRVFFCLLKKSNITV